MEKEKYNLPVSKLNIEPEEFPAIDKLGNNLKDTPMEGMSKIFLR